MNQTAVLDHPKSTPRPRKRRWLFRFFWTTFALLIGAGLYWSWARHAALVERDALIAELHAKGQPVWWDEVVEKAVAEEPENSGGPLFRQALIAFDTLAKGLPNSLSPVRDDRNGRGLFEGWETTPEMKEALVSAAPAFDLVEKAVRRKPGLVTPNLRDFEGPGWRPHLGIPAMRRFFQLRVYDSLVRNRPSDAYHSVALALQCAEQFSADPVWMGVVAGFAMRRTACDCVLECVARLQSPDEEFRAIDTLLSAHDGGFVVEHVLIGERARTLQFLENDDHTYELLAGWRGHYSRDIGALERSIYRSWLFVLATPAGAPIRVRTESEILRFTEQTMPMVERPSTSHAEIGEAYKEFYRRSPFDRAISNEVSSNLLREWTWVGSPVTLRRLHHRLILTRLALRLRRYHDKHGRFPDKLDDHCDADMPKIRLDWFGNHPITYQPSANGFRLELPKAFVPTWGHYHLDKTPIPSEYGLELELKNLQSRDSKR